MFFNDKISRRVLALLLTAAGTAWPLLGCGGGGSPVSPVGGSAASRTGDGSAVVRLQGTGASFPQPIYQKWLSEYGKINGGAQIDYQSTGSGTGVRQIQEGTVDFGASDQPMSDDELKKAQGGEIIHIPTVLGAVVITYNLPGVKQELQFSGDVVADIFAGKIKRWDDARIRADNPGAQLPAADLTVVARADGSGTSAVFSDYLAKISDDWKGNTGKQPNWPVGQRSKGNEGVTGTIKQNPNTIGYVELAFAAQQKLPIAAIKNSAGNFVKPTLDAVTAAAAAAMAQTPADMRVSITNAAAADAYPIASYTYVLVYREQKDAAKGSALVDFLWWALHDGQAVTKDPQYPYAPLPAEIVRRAEAQLNSITSGGKPLHAAP